MSTELHRDSELYSVVRRVHKVLPGPTKAAKRGAVLSGELEQIQLLLGRASVQTTERYLVNGVGINADDYDG